MTQTQGTATLVASDGGTIRRIAQLGGQHLSLCYQCGTCSVVCPQAPADGPFPRKEMVWAQWGMKDKLLADADVWMCHHCNECSIYCPRDANPGDLMAAVRAYQIEHYAAPKFLGRATSGLKFLPLALIPPVLLTFFLVLSAVIIPERGLEYPEGEILFENFIAHLNIDIFSAVAVGFAAVVAWLGGRKFWKAITQSEFGGLEVREGFVKSLMLTLVDIGTHTYFKMCKVNKPLGHAHMGLFFGFLLLLTATTMAFIWTVGLGKELSLPAWNPIKVIGNLGGISLFIGLTAVSLRRLLRPHQVGGSMYFDWYFIGVLYLLTITGFAVEILRYSGLGDAAYSTYMVHLVFYFMLFTYLPFTKFAHIVYRTLALTRARQMGRRPAARRRVLEPVPEPG